MMSTTCSSFFFLPPPLGAHLGLRCTRSWSLKPPQISARIRLTSSLKIFLYSESVGNCVFTSSSRLSTLKRIADIMREMEVWPWLRGGSNFTRRVQRSMASLASASNFFGMMFQSLANTPMAFGPRGAPACIQWLKRSRSMMGSECRPASHQSRASKERFNFWLYSFWSLITRRLGVLKGSAAVNPATMAMASQGHFSIRPKYSSRQSLSSQGRAMAM
mmetsp:Transcript_7899/g.20090  ORF Transcript_7899/g.20090 Transcript_7899/m.20090 type:complete len:218 (+) Transcript_7899:990-1643(+)